MKVTYSSKFHAYSFNYSVAIYFLVNAAMFPPQRRLLRSRRFFLVCTASSTHAYNIILCDKACSVIIVCGNITSLYLCLLVKNFVVRLNSLSYCLFLRSFFITGDKFGNLFILIPTAFFLLYVVFGCTNDRTYSSERLLSLCIMQQNLLPPLANF